jgi:hypothetical protein
MSPRMTRFAIVLYAIVAGYDWHGYATTGELWFFVTGTLFTLAALGSIAVLVTRGRRRAAHEGNAFARVEGDARTPPLA